MEATIMSKKTKELIGTIQQDEPLSDKTKNLMLVLNSLSFVIIPLILIILFPTIGDDPSDNGFAVFYVLGYLVILVVLNCMFYFATPISRTIRIFSNGIEISFHYERRHKKDTRFLSFSEVEVIRKNPSGGLLLVKKGFNEIIPPSKSNQLLAETFQKFKEKGT